MSLNNKKSISPAQQQVLFQVLQTRFEENMHRHKDIKWTDVLQKLQTSEKLWSLAEMEHTGGEPDVIFFDKSSSEFIFFDCSAESPSGRRSVCYDAEALASRKENKPKHSALGIAAEMGIAILNEEQYRFLQTFGKFDTKTSSWLATPNEIRVLGGAIFGDWRYGQVFIYHNGAESYYAARGFRGMLNI